MKIFKVSATITALSLVLLLGCTKSDFLQQSDSEETERFFKATGHVDPTVQRIIDKMKKQNQRYGFIPEIASKRGYPLWNRAVVSPNKQSNAASLRSHHRLGHTQNAIGDSTTDASSANDTSVIVPLVQDNSNYVDAYIAATVSDDITETLYSANDYVDYLPTAQNGITDYKPAEE